ncbi:MAG: YgiT-type zinc finger protein [Anaerolineae bacterium]|nr:YgiT-type zinc finger protein [Anaerolineae bacterium]MCB0244128.1 YgiT-type zinc finger protein [Anaerolineae bacterium]MCB0250289.1 YgiT-type zinc finger protein [Anaerolineae bacterium]MCB9131555.1 YgiT-type zinc finger protein [Anaerolineales bacterium]MCO5243125.1 YgiT-type zinc finger protein [Anaerolineae bacterium]
MYCLNCQGELKPGKTSYTINRNGYHLIIDDVPALVCEQCQEPLFTEEAVQLVQQMIRSLDARRAELTLIPVAV